MVETLKLSEDGGFIDEQGKNVGFSELELKLAFSMPSSIGEIRKGEVFTKLKEWGDRFGVDYVLFLLNGYRGYRGGAVSVVGIRNSSPNLAVNYYCRKQ